MTAEGANALEQLLHHPALAYCQPGRGPRAYAHSAEAGGSKADSVSVGAPNVKDVPDCKDAIEIVRQLGREAYEPAVPTLLRLWNDGPPPWLRYAAGHALFDIGTAEAHAALQAGLEQDDRVVTFLAVKSVVTTAPARAYDRLAAYLSDEKLVTPGGANRASDILRFFDPQGPSRANDEWQSGVVTRTLRDDERWARRALALRRHREVGWSARLLLAALSPDDLDRALRRWPDDAPAPPPIYAGRRDFVARYRAGEHEGVWRDLRLAGAARDLSLREEAATVAAMTMQRVRQNVETVTSRLRAAGYPFDEGDLPAWSLPPDDVAQQIARMEAATGGPCPTSLRAFWEVVGEVYWKHAEEKPCPSTPWGDFPLAEADPLCVFGVVPAWAQVESWLEDRQHQHPELVGPLDLALAPDYLHKANISGGGPYALRLPSHEFDPVLEDEEHALPFVDYLRLCFRSGGFSRRDRLDVPPRAAAFLDGLARGLEPFLQAGRRLGTGFAPAVAP
jgi:HEAT repeats